MKLITKELEKRFKEIGSQPQEKNPLVIAKFFNPIGDLEWYMTEYDAEKKVFFGCEIGNPKPLWDYFSMKTFESIVLPRGVRIERDFLFQEIRFNELMRKLELTLKKQMKEKNQTKSLDLDINQSNKY